MTAGDIHIVSGGLRPHRKAVWFKGGDTDDYVQINAAAVARTAANDTVGTWTAWINIPDVTGTYCIMCAGDDNVIEFIELNVEAGLLTARCTDGTVAQFVTQADAVGFTPHKWHHVAVVQRADGQGPLLYVDGVHIASTNDTSTDVNEWFNNCDGIDTMRIGAANKAGDASVTNEFKGAIGDVRIYTVAKTPTEILNIYKYELNGDGTNDTTSLHNHYKFDGNYDDAGTGADNGTATGTSLMLIPGYAEFHSRYNLITTPVVADSINFTVSDGVAHCLVIKAA